MWLIILAKRKAEIRIITSTPLNKQQHMVLKLRLVQKQNKLLQE